MNNKTTIIISAVMMSIINLIIKYVACLYTGDLLQFGMFKLKVVVDRGLINNFMQLHPFHLISICCVNALVALLLLYNSLTYPGARKPVKVATWFLFAGYFGNLINFLVDGYIIDYIYIIWPKDTGAVFNLDDLCIQIGVLLLAYSFIRHFHTTRLSIFRIPKI